MPSQILGFSFAHHQCYATSLLHVQVAEELDFVSREAAGSLTVSL